MEDSDFEQLVNSHYESLYRFALSLSHRTDEACDLAQQTFYLWATKGRQLRDKSKVKAWLFTTLYREFLGSRRRETRFPHYEIQSMDHELPTVTPKMVNEIDAATVMEALCQVDDLYRAPLTLFYLEDHSYKEIASILDIPIGTVMSRLARGKTQLRQILAERINESSSRILDLNTHHGQPSANRHE